MTSGLRRYLWRGAVHEQVGVLDGGLTFRCKGRALDSVGYHDSPHATTCCVTTRPVDCILCLAASKD